MVLVKIGRMGGKITELCLDNDASIAYAMKVAGMGPLYNEREEIVLNGHACKAGILSNFVANGDIILIQKKVASKMITIKVGRIGEPLTSGTIKEGATVREALVTCGRSPLGGEELWLHSKGALKGIPTNMDLMPKDGDTIVIEKVNTVTKVLHILEETIDDAGGDSCDMDLNEAAREIVEICKKR